LDQNADDEMPGGVDIDEGHLHRLIETLASLAEAARGAWDRACAHHDRTVRFEGQGFDPTGPLDDVVAHVLDALEAARTAYKVLDVATMEYWERQPDEFGDDGDDEE
jgi:hypothetical protein